MPPCRNHSYLLMAIIAWALPALCFDPARADQTLFADYKGTVAIDPGHGGLNTGAKGSDGATEKAICLTLARRLTDLMEPNYRIVLTRSDDYDVNLAERSAVANNQEADLLISLHAGAGFVRAASGVTVYYYQPANKHGHTPAPRTYDSSTPTAWRDLQMHHISASQRLAAQLRQTIETVAGIADVRVAQAPLVVLQGADMPAALIEVGYLTNPADEKRLTDANQLSVLAQAIAKGVESFLSAKITVPNPAAPD